MPSVSRLLLVSSLVGISACAALFNGKSKDLSLVSQPAGADVFVAGNRVGSTPVTYKVDNRKPVTVTFKMAGYKEQTCNLTTKVGAGWVVLDVLGGILPVVIDAATGSWSSLDGKDCNVTLELDGAPSGPVAPAPASK